MIRYSSRPCSSSSPWGLFHGSSAAYGSSYYLCGAGDGGALMQIASKLESSKVCQIEIVAYANVRFFDVDLGENPFII